jgi:hypothetical protein
MVDIPYFPEQRILLEASSLMVSVWFLVWGIRYKGEFDRELDGAAKRIRWSMVGLGIALLLASINLLGIRPRYFFAGWIWATAFLAWPNFAYYLSALLRKIRLLAD